MKIDKSIQNEIREMMKDALDRHGLTLAGMIKTREANPEIKDAKKAALYYIYFYAKNQQCQAWKDSWWWYCQDNKIQDSHLNTMLNNIAKTLN
jgi:type IV pilus biogenesis protein CpaD/CtpE